MAHFDQQSNKVLIYEYDAQLIPVNGFPSASGIGPSVAYSCTGVFNYAAYEYLNSGIFPNPSNIGTNGISLLGRTFMPVSSYYPQSPGGSGPGLPVPGNRVAVRQGVATNGYTNTWSRIMQVLNMPGSVTIRPEPSLNYQMNVTPYFAKVRVAMNFPSHNPSIFVGEYDTHAPASGFNAYSQVDGKHPAVSSFGPGLEIYSDPIPDNTPAPPQYVSGDPFTYRVMESTALLQKTTGFVISDIMRELVVRKNDSSYVLFGITRPYILDAGGNHTEVGWDHSSDTSLVTQWSELPSCIRTTSFSVPEGGSFAYGNELFAKYPSDLDSSAVVMIQFRNASNDSLLFSTRIDMAGYEGDTALYVVDTHDLSAITGNTVYMCLNLEDTTSAQSYEVHIVTSVDTVVQEKNSNRRIPLPENVELYQNSPNPFHPSTTISYKLPEAADIELCILDGLGRTMTTLVHGYCSEGIHHTEFNAGELPSGVYYYRLTLWGRILTRKMVLLR